MNQSSNGTTLADLTQRERDLARREAELDAKAKALLGARPKNNWPFCMSTQPWCLLRRSQLYLTCGYHLVFPFIYHSIPNEIPEPFQPLMTRLYQLWLVLFVTLIINMVACVFILTSGATDGGKDMGASLGSVQLSLTGDFFGRAHGRVRYLVFIAPASFLLWYRPIYNGYMKASHLRIG